MTLPDDVADLVASVLDVEIKSSEQIGGGCIAHARRVKTTRGDFFVKWARGNAADTFPAEAAGLEALRAASSPLVIPGVSFVGSGVLVLDWIEQGTGGAAFWEGFGRDLAQLHRQTGGRYGFDSDNFIGRLPQTNTWRDSWPEFFRECRLGPQVELARKSNRWQSRWDEQLERLFEDLDEILPRNPPASILHGDLWSGNYISTADGKSALIDPAVYFGDRETDLAMTELFGGFDARFYGAYREAWPLEPGYQERREVYNLYHLINHLNHFGEGYARAVDGALARRIMSKD